MKDLLIIELHIENLKIVDRTWHETIMKIEIGWDMIFMEDIDSR